MAVLCSRCRKFEEPITCFVLESGPCSVCKERATIRDQIKELEDEIAKLKVKHDTLTTPMNAIHDPLIHKLPPEIGSHIFCLSLPTLSNEEHLDAILKPWDNLDSAKILRLGSVCVACGASWHGQHQISGTPYTLGLNHGWQTPTPSSGRWPNCCQI